MTLRRMAAADVAGVQALLAAHEAQSMFARVNLAGRGVAMQVWVARDARVTGMIGLTGDGMLLVQWPAGDFAQAAQALAGNRASGILGPVDQVRALRAALGWQALTVRHDGDEPGYALTLTDLRLPESAGCSLHPLTEAPDLVAQWRAAYAQEVFGVPPAEAAVAAVRDVARWTAADSHRLLRLQGQPVALSGFNAVLPDVVQVGGVYVPPPLRNRGHARRVVGLHLAQARGAGVQRAVLFAASAAAARAYQALGFQPAGRMGLVLFETAHEIAP